MNPRPATPDEIAEAFALRLDGRHRLERGNTMMAKITAAHLVRYPVDDPSPANLEFQLGAHGDRVEAARRFAPGDVRMLVLQAEP
jgi:hypothetical protein